MLKLVDLNNVLKGSTMTEIKWHPKINRLCQLSAAGLEYALVSENYEQMHQLVSCKDFLHDVIHAYLTKRKSAIYDFEYEPSDTMPLCRSKTRLIIANWRDPDLGFKIQEKLLPLLNDVEKTLKMSPTKIERCSNVPKFYGRSGVWLIEGSKRWSCAPPMISMYTFLIRIGLVRGDHKSLFELMDALADGSIKGYFGTIKSRMPEDPDEEQDQTQAIVARQGIEHILKYGDRKLFGRDWHKNYPPITEDDEVDAFLIHDHCGITSFSCGKNQNIFPHWYKYGFPKNTQ